MLFSLEHIPRERNSHADALARAAVDVSQTLWSAAALSRSRQGEHTRALSTLIDAGRVGAPRSAQLFETLIVGCEVYDVPAPHHPDSHSPPCRFPRCRVLV